MAIDGPAGSGKSTVSRAVADALGLEHLDTGAMYRAVTLGVLRLGVDLADQPAVADVARRLDVEVSDHIVIDGRDATEAIRGPEVTATVSQVAAIPAVREVLVARQREWVELRGGGVLEGRDIGTVVMPDATVKAFLTADPGVRARRRQADEHAAERAVDVAMLAADLARRDAYDSTRTTSPLQPASDAVIIDTSDLTVGEVVARILELVDDREKGSR